MNKLFILLLIGLLLVFLYITNLSQEPSANNSKITYIDNYKLSKAKLPITSPKDAIDFFLQTNEVKNEISKEGKWWVKAERFDPINYNDVWVVVLGNGDGECGSPYQCYMRFHSNGTINSPLKCSYGWTCE